MRQRRQGRNFHLRLDEPLREKFKRAAEREVRSVSGEIIARLRASFRNEQRKATAPREATTA
jgi:hypothetical protein